MRKTQFEITTRKGKEIVNGWISANFGVHKTYPESKDSSYTVTHLRTGYKVSWFTMLNQARDFVDRMEKATFKTPWESTDISAIVANNGPKTRAIEAIARGIQGVEIPE